MADLVQQDVALRSLAAFRTRTDDGPFMPWVMRHLRIVLREQISLPVVGNKDLLAEMLQHAQDHAESYDRLRLVLRSCLHEVGGRAWELLKRHYHGRQCREQIAEAMGLKPGHVRVLINRVRAQLRRCVARHEHYGGPGEHPLLRAYLDGTLRADDHPRLETWLAESPDHQRALIMAGAMEAKLDEMVADRMGDDSALVERPQVDEIYGEAMVAAYLRGELAAAEIPRLARWLAHDAIYQRHLLLQQVFVEETPEEERVPSERYEPSTDQTPLRLRVPTPLSDRRPRRSVAMTGVSYLLAALLLLAAGVLWLAFPPQPAAKNLGVPAQDGAPQALLEARLHGSHLLVERSGQRLRPDSGVQLIDGDRVVADYRGSAALHLSDGSHVCLAPNSRLVWHGGGDRLALQQGAVTIAAVEREHEPLRVVTQHGSVAALGTVFAVETEANQTRVQVHEGHVAVSSGSQRRVMAAGSQALIERQGISLSPRTSNWLGVDVPRPSAMAPQQRPFYDLMAYARPWRADDNGSLRMRDDGWPAALAPGQMASLRIPVELSPGQYRCTWQGSGTLAFGPGALSTAHGEQWAELTLPALPQGLELTLKHTDPNDPLRAIRIRPSDAPSDAVFTPGFLAMLEGVALIRAHDWLRAASGPVLEWEQRRVPGDGPGVAGDGREPVALEHLLDLVETLDCALWLTAPHTASDGYFDGLADLMADRLAPGREVYVEYSSEIWNGVFSRVAWCREQAGAYGYQGSNAYLRFTCDRSLALWDSVTQRCGKQLRVVRVLSFNDVGFFRDTQLNHRGTLDRADALAVFGGFSGGLGAGLTGEELAGLDRAALLERCRARARDGLDELARYQAVRDRYGKRVIAYRANPTFWPHPDSGLTPRDAGYRRIRQLGHDPELTPDLVAWLHAWHQQLGEVATIQLGRSFTMALSETTPGYELWQRSSQGPRYWALGRAMASFGYSAQRDQQPEP
ncbi:MAG: FecR domain-containing protein [Planctomycetota bacterium]|nr:FecR domain-containing protein [Planctomycetota bacterium]